MTSKCANPSCSVPFHRLGGGKLFRFEVRLPSQSCRDVPETVCNTKSGRASVYFWLCEKCVLTRILRFDTIHGLSVEAMPSSGQIAPAVQGLSLVQATGQADHNL